MSHYFFRPLIALSVIFSPSFQSLSWARESANTAPGSEQVYRVRVPASSLSCEEEAVSLGTHFSRTTGLRVKTAKCVDTIHLIENEKNFSIHSLLLTFLAPQTFHIEPALYGYLNGPHEDDIGDYYGIYSSYEACLSDLGNRTREFETHSGAKPVAAFCSRARVNDSFILQVDGFGSPKKKLRTFDAAPGALLDAPRQQELQRFLTAHGASLVWMNFSRAFFYSKAPLDLNRSKMLSFQETALCTSQLEDARKIIRHVTKTQPFVHCLPSVNTIPGRVDLFAGWSGNPIYGSRMIPTRYLSATECLSDKTRVLKEIADQGQKPYGALCTRNLSGEEYVMEVYEPL